MTCLSESSLPANIFIQESFRIGAMVRLNDFTKNKEESRHTELFNVTKIKNY